MSVFETETEPRSSSEFLVSPFSVPQVEPPVGTGREASPASVLETPFAEALATVGEEELESQAVQALTAELEDEDFTDALEALVDEAAGRHLRSATAWSHESDSGRLAATEVEQWLEALAAEADYRLAQLEEHYADRPVDAVSETELEYMAGGAAQDEGFGGPNDAQEQFLGKLVRKAASVVKGAAKLVKRGIAFAGKLLPVGRIFGLLRKLIRPLLKRVLAKAIGKLPAALQPAARRLAGRIPGAAEAYAELEDEATVTSLAEQFDAAVAEAVLAPNEASAAAPLALFEAQASEGRDGASALEALDDARERLARQLSEAEAGSDPTAEMEQFIPVVMAAMPLVKLGVKVIGRGKVVGFVAKLLAQLIRPMVGAPIAAPLSRHVADAGLRLLGLEAEAEARDTIGGEALVAAAEDTIREVMSMPEASLEQELLLEAAVQEAFEEAAVRYFPGEVLRGGLGGESGEQERGVWVPLPRGPGARRRYRAFSGARPVTINRLMARSVVFREGDTLEERLLDEGVTTWPVTAEVTTYELLPGGTLGHLAAFEAEDESSATATEQFSELEDEGLLPGPPMRGGRQGRPGGLRRAGAGPRITRIRVAGRPVRRRRRFSVRLDITGPAPQLVLSLLISERLAHQLAGELARRRHAQVVAVVRRRLGPAWQRATAARLGRMLSRHGMALPEGGSARLAAQLAAVVERTVAARLPEAAATLAAAAKDPAPGITLSFAVPFADRNALVRGEPGEPTLSIRPGAHRA
jgi:hypothetical protein